MVDRSAIILAVDSHGVSSEDKGLWKLDNKPLLNYVVDAVKGIVGEVLVVTRSKEQSKLYSKTASSANVQFTISADEPQGSLAAALSGFEAAQGKYSMLWPFDAPFVSKEIVSLFFDCCVGKSAVVPRWPSNEIEPFNAVYDTQQAIKAAEDALVENIRDLDVMVCKMRGVRYLSTLVIEQLDPDFRIFFRVKSPLDLKKAVSMKKPRKRR